MNQYQPRIHTVTGHKVTDHDIYCPDGTPTWPSWIAERWGKDTREIHALCPHFSPMTGDYAGLYLNTIGGMRYVQPGDWIIQHENGDMDVIQEADFDLAYEKVTVQ